VNKPVDLSLLERWLAGWSLSRNLPLPSHDGGGLVVEVGWPDQLRRHVFADTGPALREWASRVHEPLVHVKAPVDPEQLMRALPSQWEFEVLRFLMSRATAVGGAVTAPPGYVAHVEVEHGAQVVRFTDASGQVAAEGRVVLHRRTAVFDRIETLESHRRKGLGSALMAALDALAEQAGATERLLVATEAGRELYLRLGWTVLAPYSTAVFLPTS
jgi:GNAT superfamily N-acetyltransferase